MTADAPPQSPRGGAGAPTGRGAQGPGVHSGRTHRLSAGRRPEPPVPGAFFTKVVDLGAASLKLEIWDTAGQEKYHSVCHLYFRGANAALLVYDITSKVGLAGRLRPLPERGLRSPRPRDAVSLWDRPVPGLCGKITASQEPFSGGWPPPSGSPPDSPFFCMGGLVPPRSSQNTLHHYSRSLGTPRAPTDDEGVSQEQGAHPLAAHPTHRVSSGREADGPG